MAVIHGGILRTISPCEHVDEYIEERLVLHGTLKNHFTQVQTTGTTRAPGFFASTAVSNIYFKNIKDQESV